VRVCACVCVCVRVCACNLKIDIEAASGFLVGKDAIAKAVG